MWRYKSKESSDEETPRQNGRPRGKLTEVRGSVAPFAKETAEAFSLSASVRRVQSSASVSRWLVLSVNGVGVGGDSDLSKSVKETLTCMP